VAKGFQRPDLPRAKQEAQTLSDAGFPVYVLAWDRYAEFPMIENVDGVMVQSFSSITLKKFSRLGLVLGGMVFQFMLILKTIRLIRQLRRRPIVHAHDLNTLLAGCLFRIFRLCSALVYDCRELTYSVYAEWFHPLVGAVLRVVEERCLRYVDATITVCEPIARYLSGFTKHIEIIYNCARMADIPMISKNDARIQLGLVPEAFIVSYVGSIRYGCKLDLLLDVASQINNDNIHFMVVGDGPLSSGLRRAARQIPKARLTVLSGVPRTKALTFVRASDLTWSIYQNRRESTSLRIALPWKLFESLACGVPLLVETGTLQAELVNKLRCGVVLESDDPEDVLQAITSLANDPDRRERMSQAARKGSVDLNYSWEAMSVRLINLYKKLAC
jgi:glycosyltransferase involved in cell wall biosynthesis